MATASVEVPRMKVRLTIKKPVGYRFRLSIIMALLRVASWIAPASFELYSEVKRAE